MRKVVSLFSLFLIFAFTNILQAVDEYRPLVLSTSGKYRQFPGSGDMLFIVPTYGLAAAIPAAAASNTGQLYYATDTGYLYRSNGATWDTLTFGSTAGGDLTGTYPSPNVISASHANGFWVGASDVGGGSKLRVNGDSYFSGQAYQLGSGGILSRYAATQHGIRLLGYNGGTSDYILTLSPAPLTGNRTVSFQDTNYTVAGTNITQTITGQNTFSGITYFTNAIEQTYTNGIFTRQDGTSNGMRMTGSGAGSSNFAHNLTSVTLTGNRTAYLPDSTIYLSGSTSALTSGRVPYVTTGGVLTDSANLLFDGTSLVLGTDPGGSEGIRSSENMFIGAPAAGAGQITVAGNGNASGSGLLLQQDAASDGFLYNRSNNPLYFGTNNTTRGYIGAAGGWVFNDAAYVNGSNAYYQINEAGAGKWYVQWNSAANETQYYSVNQHNFLQLAEFDLGIKISGGTSAPDRITVDPTYGLNMYAHTGAPYDFNLFNAAGGYMMRVPTGTSNVEFLGSVQGASLQALSASAQLYLDRTGSGNSSIIFMRDTTATRKNWMMGIQYNVDNGFEITQSTTAGGSTYSDIKFRIDTGGDVTFSGSTINLDGANGTLLANNSDFEINSDGELMLTVAAGTGLKIDASANTTGGLGSLATTATDGFLYIPTCAGTPTGTPTTKTGFSPIVIDSTNNKLYFYSGGSWRDAGP